MVEINWIEHFDKLVRKEVGSLCHSKEGHPFYAVNKIINMLKNKNATAVIFGGAIRSMVQSRLLNGKRGRPRDFDIVVEGLSLLALENLFEPWIMRITRFGGLQLNVDGAGCDIWPLDRTKPLMDMGIQYPSFNDLPKCTFLNVEAIAASLTPLRGKPRSIYKGNNEFYNAFRERCIELNNPDTAYPELNTIRALVMASSLSFSIGPKLSLFIIQNGALLNEAIITEIQLKHYGVKRALSFEIIKWIDYINKHYGGDGKAIVLPQASQEMLDFDLKDNIYDRLNAVIKSNRARCQPTKLLTPLIDKTPDPLDARQAGEGRA